MITGLLAATPRIAAAQTAAPVALERIVITAEKRLTLVDATPEAVTALSGAKLRDIGVTDLAGVATLVPNMSFTSLYGSSQPFIRGIGNVFFTAGGDPGVAMYADGSYLSDQTSSNASLFDLQRVEVLRGPQGALYGRNATGGAVNLISARPTDSFKASVGVLFGDQGRKESEGFVSGPLGQGSTSARLAYQLKSLDGYTSNPLAGQSFDSVLPGGQSTVGPRRLDDLSTQSLRLQTATDLGASGNLRLIAGYHRQQDNGPSLVPLVDPVMVSGLLLGVVPSSDPRIAKSQGASNRVDVNTLQAIYERPVGTSTLSLSASYRKSGAGVFVDGDATEALTAGTRFTTASTDRSVDAHLTSDETGRLQWLVGATYLRFDQQQDIQVQSKVPLGFLQPGAPLNIPVPVEFLLGGQVRTVSSAVYADLRYAITPTLALQGGLRLSRDEKTATEYQTVAAFGLNGSAAPAAAWNSTPGSVGLEWKIGPDSLAYGKLSHGFKSGAINLGNLQPEAVKPETVTSVELGAKTSFLERRGSVAAAVFASRYKDMQVSQVGLASVILSNASAARINGVEVELMLRPVTAWTLGLNLGLMDPTYTDFVNTNLRVQPAVGPVSVSGNQLANVSRVQTALNAEWAQAVGDYRASVRADYAWRSKFYFTEFNTTDAVQAAYGLLNLSATLRPVTGSWKLYAQLKNATNTTALTSMTIASPILLSARSVGYNPPRSLGVGANFDF
jgi:outer membrane receptor protein involved in Fe transport